MCPRRHNKSLWSFGGRFWEAFSRVLGIEYSREIFERAYKHRTISISTFQLHPCQRLPIYSLGESIPPRIQPDSMSCIIWCPKKRRIYWVITVFCLTIRTEQGPHDDDAESHPGKPDKGINQYISSRMDPETSSFIQKRRGRSICTQLGTGPVISVSVSVSVSVVYYL